MPLKIFLKYLRTIKYLKRTQVIYRLKRPFKKIKFISIANLKTRNPVNPFIPVKLNERSMWGNNQFMFLNKEGSLKGWNDPNYDKLWLYNLHYFNDLSSVDSGKRTDLHVELIDKWIFENPPMQGNGWEPYPISLRIVNWIKWFIANDKITKTQSCSLSLQTNILMQTLEKHLLGNHLFANAKALIFSGIFFEGQEADQWLEKGLEILASEIPEQILADGGNFELSPMYHATMTADMLDLLSLLEAYSDNRCYKLDRIIRQLLPKMLKWLYIMSHPNGECAFFNDSALGVAPTCSQLLSASKAYGLKIDLECRGIGTIDYLPESGYFRLNLQDAVVIGDVARIGPDYIPGHAHADTLSFEFSVFGDRFIVNSGTSVYGSGRERLRQRGTSAHNTVTIDGEDSSEVWGGFRVAHRARPIDLQINPNDKLIRCAHDGYSRLPGKPIHRREWHYYNSSLVIKDTIIGSFNVAQARYHFHPNWNCSIDGNEVICLHNGEKVTMRIASGKGRIEASTYHPKFGFCIENAVLLIEFDRRCPLAELRIDW